MEAIPQERETRLLLQADGAENNSPFPPPSPVHSACQGQGEALSCPSTGHGNLPLHRAIKPYSWAYLVVTDVGMAREKDLEGSRHRSLGMIVVVMNKCLDKSVCPNRIFSG